jgi:hypothetical protein
MGAHLLGRRSCTRPWTQSHATTREATSRGGRAEEPPQGVEPHGGTGGRLSGRRSRHGPEARGSPPLREAL